MKWVVVIAVNYTTIRAAEENLRARNRAGMKLPAHCDFFDTHENSLASFSMFNVAHAMLLARNYQRRRWRAKQPRWNY